MRIQQEDAGNNLVNISYGFSVAFTIWGENSSSYIASQIVITETGKSPILVYAVDRRLISIFGTHFFGPR